MKDPNVQKEWADEFKRKWPFLDYAQKNVQEEVKIFITNLLTSHNNSLVERLEEMRPARKTEEETHNTYNDGKRDLIDQAQELIKNSLTKKTKP